MPVISMGDLRNNAKERKDKKVVLTKQLCQSIEKDIKTELNKLSEITNSLVQLCDTGDLISSDIRIPQSVIPTLLNAIASFESTFNKNSPYYMNQDAQEFRKLIFNAIARKKYSYLMERIKNVGGDDSCK